MGDKKKRNENIIKEGNLMVMKFPGFETRLPNNCYNQDFYKFFQAKTVLCTVSY